MNLILMEPQAISNLSVRLAEYYDNLRFATEKAQAAAKHAHETRRAVEYHRSAIILEHAADPKAMGANEAAREAYLRDKTVYDRSLADAADALQRDADNSARIAALDVEAARAQLRILEVATAAGRLAHDNALLTAYNDPRRYASG